MTEDAQLRAHSLVTVFPQGETVLLHETPAEIRARMAEFREATSMGLGVEDLEEKSGLLVFMGIDVYMPEGDSAEPIIEPVEMSLHPGSIGKIRGVSERYWKGHVGVARAQGAEQPPHVPPGVSGLEDVLRAAGFNPTTIDLGTLRPPEPPGHGAQPAVVSEVEPATICCCDHSVADHDISGKFVGACKVEGCDCYLFHTHDEAPEEKT